MEENFSNSEIQNFANLKIDKFIKSQIKKLISTETDLRDWIKKFFSEEWYIKEQERIKEFESIADNIEDFKDDPIIEETYSVTGIDGKTKIYKKKPPEIDKSRIQESLKKVIPKYSKKAEDLLGKAKSKLSTFDLEGITKRKKILKIISEKLDNYWEYLSFIRTAYVDIFNIIRMFKYSLTMKFLMNSIIMQIYDIDKQRWYRDRILSYKNIMKIIK
ncbi:MAG: hypothetical protein ACTSRH_07240 [Promethearchaeota archaeon]